MRIVLAGGGTAGHVEPALAVAREFRNRDASTEILFVGTSHGIENQLVPEAGFDLAHINKLSFPRRISPALILWPFRFVNIVVQALAIVAKSDAVIGFGGYVSAPIYVAAAIRRIPIFVHEANALPGLANRLGSLIARSTMVAFASTQTGTMRNAEIVGIPLRESIVSAASLNKAERNETRARTLAEWGMKDLPTILIFGGSTGSAHMNSVVSESVNSLLDHNLQIVHVVGKKNELPLSRPGYLPLHYIDSMAEALIAADVVISRSGAVTCVELAVLNKFALLVPLSIGNGEQRFNGEPLVANNQALMIENKEFTSKWLSHNIDDLIARSKGEHRGALRFPLNSAQLIVDIVEKEMKEDVR